MSRIVKGLALTAGLVSLIASSFGSVTAETVQFSGPSQVVSGATGYSYGIPADWQLVSTAIQQRTGDQLLVADGEAVSADGKQLAHVETATNLDVPRDHLADALAGFLGIGQGGSAPGAPSLSTFAGPDPVQVSNADGAVSGAVKYKDSSGADRVVAARLATRQGTTFVLALDVTMDFYQSDPAFAAIMNSFQLP
jgi:hypothetical protein